ncbi:unnamed protein product [Nesidiocoris tenuis]|uniref:Uncharacterized protein n=1 Tax=Nesidiocoris tenuis TaxID=355587 RepID=A0A6H5G480_9HEMI|nr:unnamed protein product [Nesidiocoris tenuis]
MVSPKGRIQQSRESKSRSSKSLVTNLANRQKVLDQNRTEIVVDEVCLRRCHGEHRWRGLSATPLLKFRIAEALKRAYCRKLKTPPSVIGRLTIGVTRGSELERTRILGRDEDGRTFADRILLTGGRRLSAGTRPPLRDAARSGDETRDAHLSRTGGQMLRSARR